MKGTLKSIRDVDLHNIPVFMRLDFNVPLSEPAEGEERTIEDTTRIDEALPTIQYALAKGARLILASHLGRPKGKPTPEYSLEPIAKYLAKVLDRDVTLTEDCVGE